jgi:dihydrofolate synthase/folylpolyglutamate synthase
MNYKEAMDYIHNTLKYGSRPGLQRIEKLLELMGNPHKKLKFVHVAGTNGKGSTSAFISNILIEAGYKTGLFTSPYIQRFTERIRINNTEISEGEIAELITYAKSKIDIMQESGLDHPTEFEINTAIAFEYFYRQKCQIAVMEAGMGGREDSTNVIEYPEVSVITTISLDHTDRLGNTISEIARHKAGIIKSGSDAVIYPQKAEIECIFEQECKNTNAIMHKVDLSTLILKSYSLDGQVFDYKNYKNLNISLLGDHQLCNAAVAIDTCEILAGKGFNICETDIKCGISRTLWPGRLEIISREPLVFIDGAHNFEGGQALNSALDRYFADKEKIYITGFLKDKEYNQIMELLAPKAKLIITVTPDNLRALTSNEVVDGVTVENSLKLAIESGNDKSVICGFGSLYMIGELRKFFV